jgi:hypothetical protein
MANRYNLKNYIWKAEVQKNGNIHFHILQETYVHHSDLRALWNSCQDKLGYVQEFTDRVHKENPNSTDIHALKGVRNVEAYVSKYMSKFDAVRPICGHVWGRSDTFTNLQPFALHNDLDLHEWFNMMEASIDHKTFTGDQFSVTNFKTAPNWRTLPAHHKKTISEITRHNLHSLRLI